MPYRQGRYQLRLRGPDTEDLRAVLMAAGIFVRSAAELQIGPASTAGSGVSVLRVTVDADSLDEAIAIAERAAGPGYGVEPD